MKEQVKAILFDFKDAGWSVQKVEKELGFSNGSLGKAISDYRYCKLLELHGKEIKKPVTITNDLQEKIAHNNLPEIKEKVLAERNTKPDNLMGEIIITPNFEKINRDDLSDYAKKENAERIVQLEKELKNIPSKLLIPRQMYISVREKELAKLKSSIEN